MARGSLSSSDESDTVTDPGELSGGDADVAAEPPDGRPDNAESSRRVWSRGRPWSFRHIPRRMWLPLVVYAVTQIGFLVWWAALYPAQLSYDSVTYVWQVTEDNWMTNHSVTYNVLVWLSLKATGGLAALTFAQTVVLAAAIAYTVVGIRSLGVPGRWLAICAAALVLFPSVGLFAVYVSKDVPFVISQLLLVGTLARIVALRRTSSSGPPVSIRDRRMWVLLALVFAEMAGLALFRQNGLLVVLATAVVLAVLLRGLRGWLLVIGIAGAAVSLLGNLVVFPALGVKTASSDLLLGPAYADIAVIYQKRPSAVRSADRELMSRLAPLSTWRENANCYSSDTTTRTLDLQAAAANSGEMFDLWVRLVKRAPDVFIDARLCRGTIAWNVKTGPAAPAAAAGTIRIAPAGTAELRVWRDRLAPDNPYRSAITRQPFNDKLYKAAVFVRQATVASTLTPLIWRGAFWCYLAYLAVFLFARRRREWSIFALVAVAFANQIVVLVNNPAQLSRYMMGPIIIGVLLMPLLFAQRGLSRGGRGDERAAAPQPG